MGFSSSKFLHFKIFTGFKVDYMKKEELNFLSNLFIFTILKYMNNKYDSVDFKKTTKTIQKAVEIFESKLKELDSNRYCLNAETLLKHKLLKEKYYVYGAFLAAISSYPILYRIADEESIISSIFSKTSIVTGIKVLDNINDSLHNFQDATRSQLNFQQALTQGYVNFCRGEESLNWIKKAENSTYLMALWGYQSIVSSCGRSKMFNMFARDVDEYIDGQIRSFYQKNDKYTTANMDLAEFIQKVSTKCFGKLWIDVDFCFYEKFFKKIPSDEMIAVKMINRSIDLLFRSLLFYDDATDLEEDIENNIVNSVMILGFDTGKILAKDILMDKKCLPEKLEKLGVIRDAIHVGNILYLSGVEQLFKAKMFTRYIDVDALIFCARVLRMFLLRKLLKLNKKLKGLSILLQSFSPFEKLKKEIPDYLYQYHKLIVNLNNETYEKESIIEPVSTF